MAAPSFELSGIDRGQEDPVGTVLCRMKLFLKAIGLQLLIILKILLWMLPGIAAATEQPAYTLRARPASIWKTVESTPFSMEAISISSRYQSRKLKSRKNRSFFLSFISCLLRRMQERILSPGSSAMMNSDMA